MQHLTCYIPSNPHKSCTFAVMISPSRWISPPGLGIYAKGKSVHWSRNILNRHARMGKMSLWDILHGGVVSVQIILQSHSLQSWVCPSWFLPRWYHPALILYLSFYLSAVKLINNQESMHQDFGSEKKPYGSCGWFDNHQKIKNRFLGSISATSPRIYVE